MARDPLAHVVDAPLFIVPRVLDGLRAYRARAPSGLLVALADTLLAGIEAHPTKFWVLRQFQKTLEQVADEDKLIGSWRNCHAAITIALRTDSLPLKSYSWLQHVVYPRCTPSPLD